MDQEKRQIVYRSLVGIGIMPSFGLLASSLFILIPLWVIVASFGWASVLCAAAAFHIGRYTEKEGKCPLW